MARYQFFIDHRDSTPEYSSRDIGGLYWPVQDAIGTNNDAACVLDTLRQRRYTPEAAMEAIGRQYAQIDHAASR